MMLKIIISDKKPAPTPVISYTPNQINTNNLAIYNEAKRRDSVIKELVKQCQYKKNDTVVGATEMSDKTYLVRSICDTYAHLGREFKWPANDNPMIVELIDEEGVIFNATTNYVKPV